MNVIIRLQNLPWSANASDIRQFFKNCAIPEGGVHIVGGENGDAFIAFSTDEDARQAMHLNGGKIKATQVSLLLSSRAEMQKVIEKARQATTSSFMGKISTQQAVLPASMIANQFANAKKAPEVAAPQPPVISLTNFLTQSMQQQTTPNPIALPAHQLNMMSAYQTMQPNDIPGLGALPAVAPNQLGMPPNAAAAAAAYNYYATLMDPNALSYVNSMAGMNVKQADMQRDMLPSFNKDPRGRRSNSRERNSYKRQRSRSPDRKMLRRSRSNSRDRFTDSDKEGKDASRRRTRFNAVNDIPPILSTLPPGLNKSAVGYSVPPPAANNNSKLSPWEVPPPQVFPNFNQANSSVPPTRHYQTENNSSSNLSSHSFGNIGTCVKVSNVDSETYYSDLRKFFSGLPIGNNDIKFVTDQKGNKTGVVLIRFLSSDSKKKALTKSMWQLKSTQVMITSISEEDFDSGLINSNKGGNRQMGMNNYKNDDRRDTRNDRFRERSNSRERDNHNRNFNRYDGGNHRNNRFDDRPNNNNRDNGGGNYRRDQHERNFKSSRNDEPQIEEIKIYEPDENFTVLVIDDIPRTANEPDICEAFPNIVSITIDRYTAYVKFTSHDAAKVTLENRFIHYIRNKRVFLEAGSDAQFNDLSKKFGKFDNPENKSDKEEALGDDANFNNEQINEDTNHSNNSNSRDSSRDQRPFESRDPRQRNFSNDRFAGNGQPMMKTDCVIMKNMDPSTEIPDIEHFYKDIGIYKMNVHILLDKRGKPCGDCFVEFKYPNDSGRAVSKNNQLLKDRRVQIMQIPREQVEAVLSSFGGDNGMRSQNRQSRPDWAPPGDFGRPGCVIMLSNLCYKAAIEDILEEFREFDLRPDQVIRRFNDQGQPTGNACINFNSPQDADLAIEKYNSIKIMNRAVWLKRI